MKHLLLTIILCISTLVSGQRSSKEYFTISTSIDPVASYNDGLIDIAAEIEYVGFIYAKAGIEYFPALEPQYFDIHGAIGINVFLDRFQTFRGYGGIRLGRIFRENKSKGELIGFETGIDYAITDTFFIGLRATYDYRNDGVPLGWDEYWRESGYIRLGYRW